MKRHCCFDVNHNHSLLIGPCGIETRECGYTEGIVYLLIGPCGIETAVRDAEVFRHGRLLIGPCGIETVQGTVQEPVSRLLIGPCGIETEEPGVDEEIG